MKYYMYDQESKQFTQAVEVDINTIPSQYQERRFNSDNEPYFVLKQIKAITLSDGSVIPQVPNGTHLEAPGVPEEGFIRVFLDGQWQVIPDYRKAGYFNTDTGQEVIILPGHKPTDKQTNIPRPAASYKWVAGEWVEDADARVNRLSQEARVKRDELLVGADLAYNIARDSGDDEKVAVISTYRQALRDLPDQAGFPETIEWPKY